MSRGEGLLKLYNNGGTPMLAYRLGVIFTKIETEEDKVRHNDMVTEVLDLINTERVVNHGKVTREENTFLQFIASWLIYKKYNRKKKFLIRLADKILQMGQKKG